MHPIATAKADVAYFHFVPLSDLSKCGKIAGLGAILGSGLEKCRYRFPNSLRRMSQRLQEVHQVGLLLVGEANREPLIIEVDDIHERRR